MTSTIPASSTSLTIYNKGQALATLDKVPEKKGIYHYKDFDILVCTNFIVIGSCDRIDPMTKTSLEIMGLLYRIKSFRRFGKLYILNVIHDGRQEQVFLYDYNKLIAKSVSTQIFLFNDRNVPLFKWSSSKITKKHELIKDSNHRRWYDAEKHLFLTIDLPKVTIQEMDFQNPGKIGNLFQGKIIVHENIVSFLLAACKTKYVVYAYEVDKKIKYMFCKTDLEFHYINDPDTNYGTNLEVTEKELDTVIDYMKTKIHNMIDPCNKKSQKFSKEIESRLDALVEYTKNKINGNNSSNSDMIVTNTTVTANGSTTVIVMK